MGGTNPISRSLRHHSRLTRARLVHGGIVRMPRPFVIALSLLLSLFFILALSCAFIGYESDIDYFQSILDDAAENSPGIVLLGENVDVDIDEPSLGIRWSVLGCGSGFVLNGSSGAHGSDQCGLPSAYLEIFIDGAVHPTAVFDPSLLPFVQSTSTRRYIQNLVQFDSDHTLDVHSDRLYPFDTYYLTSTIRVVGSDNVTLPIVRIATISEVSAFAVKSSDIESFVTLANGTQVPTRDLDLWVSRPFQARSYAFLLWAVNWLLTHGTVGQVVVARSCQDAKPVLKHLIAAFAIIVAIPQLRGAMPDGPDFDGVLIDCIGFFPQMIISTFSIVSLLVLAMARENAGPIEELQEAPRACPVAAEQGQMLTDVTVPPQSPAQKVPPPYCADEKAVVQLTSKAPMSTPAEIAQSDLPVLDNDQPRPRGLRRRSRKVTELVLTKGIAYNLTHRADGTAVATMVTSCATPAPWPMPIGPGAGERRATFPEAVRTRLGKHLRGSPKDPGLPERVRMEVVPRDHTPSAKRAAVGAEVSGTVMLAPMPAVPESPRAPFPDAVRTRLGWRPRGSLQDPEHARKEDATRDRTPGGDELAAAVKISGRRTPASMPDGLGERRVPYPDAVRTRLGWRPRGSPTDTEFPESVRTECPRRDAPICIVRAHKVRKSTSRQSTSRP